MKKEVYLATKADAKMDIIIKKANALKMTMKKNAMKDSIKIQMGIASNANALILKGDIACPVQKIQQSMIFAIVKMDILIHQILLIA